LKVPPIFIVGVGRSGTTLIRQMLNSHSNIAIPYESHFITKYQDNINAYGNLSTPENLNILVNDILQEPILKLWDVEVSVEQIVSQIGNTVTLESVIDAFFSSYASTHSKARWGDKSDYLDRMYKIRKLFPDAKFIHIIRDGRDVTNSVLKMTWGPCNVKQAAEWWSEHVRLGYCAGRMLPVEQYMEVRYEDLVLDTEKQLKRLCHFIDEEFEADMLEYYKTSSKYIPKSLLNQHYNADVPPAKNRVYAWKNSMSQVDVKIFEQIAEPVLREFGYEVSNQKVNTFALLAKKITYLF